MRLLVTLLCLLLPSFAFASDLSISDARSFQLVKGTDIGVVFMTIENKGAKDVSLVSATANSVCHTIEMHTHETQGDVMAMRKIDTIPVSAGSKTELKPGGLHLMLIGIKQSLLVGDSFPVTLRFSDGQTIQQIIQVESPSND